MINFLFQCFYAFWDSTIFYDLLAFIMVLGSIRLAYYFLGGLDRD